MEDKRTEMGFMGARFREVNEKVDSLGKILKKHDDFLAEKITQHTEVVTQRDIMQKNKLNLQLTVERIQKVITSYAARRRQYLVASRTDRSIGWGDLLIRAAHATYLNAFNPRVRTSLRRDLTNLYTGLRLFTTQCPTSVIPVQLRYQIESVHSDGFCQDTTISMEIARKIVNIVLDPFEFGKAWLMASLNPVVLRGPISEATFVTTLQKAIEPPGKPVIVELAAPDHIDPLIGILCSLSAGIFPLCVQMKGEVVTLHPPPAPTHVPLEQQMSGKRYPWMNCFAVYVLIPQCPWNCVALWSCAQSKAVEPMLKELPRGTVWAALNVCCFDIRPVHPVRCFLPLFHSSDDTNETGLQKDIALVAEYGYDLHVIESMISWSFSDMAPRITECELEAFDALLKLDERAEAIRLKLLHAQEDVEDLRVHQASYRSQAGTCAVIFCALIDLQEVYREGRYVDLSYDVSGLRLSLSVMKKLVAHVRMISKNDEDMILNLFSVLFATHSDAAGATLRYMLYLETRAAKQPGQSSTLAGWDFLVHRANEIHTTPDGNVVGDISGLSMNSEHNTAELSVSDGAGGQCSASVVESDHAEGEGRESNSNRSRSSEDGSSQLEGESSAPTESRSRSSSSDKPEEEDKRPMSVGYNVRLEEFQRGVDRMFPCLRNDPVPEDIGRHLKCLPQDVPVLVSPSSYLFLAEAAEACGCHLEEESVLTSGDGFEGLMHKICSVLNFDNTWLMFDVANVEEFYELWHFIDCCRYIPALEQTHVVDPLDETKVLHKFSRTSRLFLFSSEANTLLPTYIAEMCFPIANLTHCFGLLVERHPGSFPLLDILHEENATKEVRNDADQSGATRSTLNPTERARTGTKLFGDKSPTKQPTDHLSIHRGSKHLLLGSRTQSMCDRKMSTHRSGSISMNFTPRNGDGAGGLGASERHASQLFVAMASEGKLSRGSFTRSGSMLKTQYIIAASVLVQNLEYSHPLFVEGPASETLAGKSSDAMWFQVSETLASMVAEMQRDEKPVFPSAVDRIAEFVVDNIIMPLHGWTMSNALHATLLRFSPQLIAHTEKQVRDRLKALMQKLSDLHSQVVQVVTKLTFDTPYWLSKEIKRNERMLSEIVEKVANVDSALRGDMRWDRELELVFSSISIGRAPWAGQRPLADWLNSLQSALSFFLSWAVKDESVGPVSLQVGCLENDITSFFCSDPTIDEVFFVLEHQKVVEDKKDDSAVPLVAAPKNVAVKNYDIGGPPRGTAKSISHSKPIGKPFLIQDLHIFNASWRHAGLTARESGAPYLERLPQMMLTAYGGKGPSKDYFLCPLLIVHKDQCGADFARSPKVQVYVRTRMPVSKCALTGVRLVAYA